MRRLLALLLLCLFAGLVVRWLARPVQNVALDPATQLDEPRASSPDAAHSVELAAQVQAPSSREALAQAEVREASVEDLPSNDGRLFGRVVACDTKLPIAGAQVQLVQIKMLVNSTGTAASI